MITVYSMWSLFRNCRRAAQFRYVEIIVPIERDPNLAFGSLIHECLEMWHRDQNLPAVLGHIDSAYIKRTPPPNPRRAPLRRSNTSRLHLARGATDQHTSATLLQMRRQEA